MAQANDQPSDRERSVDRQFRILDRRISKLGDTQVTWRELNNAFVDHWSAFGNRIYEKIDELKLEMNQRFNAQDTKIDNLGIELNGKLDRNVYNQSATIHFDRHAGKVLIQALHQRAAPPFHCAVFRSPLAFHARFDRVVTSQAKTE